MKKEKMNSNKMSGKKMKPAKKMSGKKKMTTKKKMGY